MLAADHWIPSVAGGKAELTNILPLCHCRKGKGVKACNSTKLGKEPVKWLIQILGQEQADIAHARILAYFEWVKNVHPPDV